MARRITVASTVPDSRSTPLLKILNTLAPKARVVLSLADSYVVDARVPEPVFKEFARRLTNPIVEQYVLDRVSLPRACSWIIEIGFLPGVTDNMGTTARETLEDVLGKKIKPGEGVYTSRFICIRGALSEAVVRAFANALHNPLIERAAVYSARSFRSTRLPVVPKVRLSARGIADSVSLEVPDNELEKIGKEGIENADGTHRGPLALSLKSLQAIREYFRKEGRDPTDIELESLAQTWSEHCKHTIFSDPLGEVQEGIYRRYIKGATNAIRKKKGKKDFCVSVFTDNSGAIRFDKDYLITHKVETHNSPSALDPFGGAITGIVGVNRDCLGFGLGAKPIANIYGFCVGDPADTRTFFRDSRKTQPLLSARRILEGVVKGVNAGGNQSGIPTPLGFIVAHDSYRGKPLVFAGTVGLIPERKGGRLLYKKKIRPGDYIVMAGGRVGLDGIHGATFSSESLSSGSPATAVQIGDPITQKKLSDALIREARDKGLYSAITDNGAGGLSSSVSEMARDMEGKGGCEVDLDAVPLKYPGLSPWQIWISESQERMTLAVPPRHWKALRALLEKRGVEATVIGRFRSSGRCILRFKRRKVMDMAMSFLHDGRPVEVQLVREVKNKPEVFFDPSPRLEDAVLSVVSRPSVAGIRFVSEQYDHEVQGTSITKPLQGRGRVNAEAAVLQPLSRSPKGVVLSHGYAPWYSAQDTYAMAAAAVDTAIRNAVAAGASLEHLAILDNFCWSSSDTPERLYELERAARACHDAALSFGTPFISGKDSMFNDFRGWSEMGERVHIAALPTLLISAIGVMRDASRAVTLDFKMPGDAVYVLGETRSELGHSEYAHAVGALGGTVPHTDARKNASTYRALSRAIAKGLVASALGVGRGGLAVALSKSSIAGGYGLTGDLSLLPGNISDARTALFSESQGRLLVSVSPERTRDFERSLKGIPCVRIGKVSREPRLFLRACGKRISLPLSALKAAYDKPFGAW